MSKSRILQGLKRSLSSGLRIRHDERGVAAVEFGLIAPVLLLILVIVAEVTRGVAIDRRLGQVTSMIADLVSREENMNSADLNSIYAIAGHVMGNWGTDTLQIEVIPVKANPTNYADRKVYAATTNRPTYGGVTAKPECQAYTTLPVQQEFLPAGSSVIVVETKYHFTPIFTQTSLVEGDWKDKATFTPRNACVDFDNDNCVSSCF